MEINLSLTMLSGQPPNFIFSKVGDKFYRAVNGKIIWAEPSEQGFKTNSKRYFNDLFDKDLDLKKVYGRIATDSFMKKAVNNHSGLRITKNSVWETTLCFILSSNNSINNIRALTQKLMAMFGDKVDEFYEFPSIESIAEAKESELRTCKTGFRALYLKATAKSLLDNKWVFNVRDKKTVKDFLMEQKGIGDKVSECILLFGYNFLDSFPIDVWVRRAMQSLYLDKNAKDIEIREKADDLWKGFQGYAQQYLFYEFMSKKLFV